VLPWDKKPCDRMTADGEPGESARNPTADNAIVENESLWPSCLRRLGIGTARLVSRSSYDFGRRTYEQDGYLYKIVLRDYETTQNSRRQTLAGEYAVVRDCSGVPGIPLAVEYRQMCGMEFIRFQYLAARSLADLGSSAFRRVMITWQLLPILARLSSRKVVHNDLRADNILVCDKGNVFLVDFDQAIRTSAARAWALNFLSLVKYGLLQITPARLTGWLKRVRDGFARVWCASIAEAGRPDRKKGRVRKRSRAA